MCTGIRIVRDRPRDGLTNPPGGVGRKFVAALVLELVDRLHQADVAFLNQIQELQAAIRVLLCNRNNQAQVRFDQLALGLRRSLRSLLVAFRCSVNLCAPHVGTGFEFGGALGQQLELFTSCQDPRRVTPQLGQCRATAGTAARRQQG
jgi:hypothetical protein